MIFLSWYYIIVGFVAMVVALREKSFSGCLLALAFFAGAMFLTFVRIGGF